MGRATGAGVVFVAVAAVVTACDKSDSIVIVTVVADQDVAGVFRLRAVASNAGTGATRTFPAAAASAAEAITFPTAFSLTVPRDRTGALDIALEGIDGGDVAIATGASTVDLRVGDNVAVTIALHAGAPTCGNGQLDAGEECDDGDRVSSGGCDYICRILRRWPRHRRHGRHRRHRRRHGRHWRPRVHDRAADQRQLRRARQAGRRMIRPGGR